MGGYRFLRQKPIVYHETKHKRHFFVADFYCAELDLVIELDEKYHEYRKYEDYNRDLVLKNLGLKVLRIQNEELQHLDDIKERILKELD